MSTPTALYTHQDYVAQLLVLLADLNAERFAGAVRVGGVATGLMVYVETYDVRNEVARISIEKSVYTRRRGRHVFKNIDPAHIAQAVRRILAEKVTAREAQKVAYAAQVAEENRAIEAGAQVRAVAERVGISHVTVEEQGDFRFGFRLENLTEAQALAVLAIVEGAVPPPGAWSFSGRPPQQEDGGQ